MAVGCHFRSGECLHDSALKKIWTKSAERKVSKPHCQLMKRGDNTTLAQKAARQHWSINQYLINMPSVQIEDNHKVLLYMILILILYMIAIVQTLNCVLRRAMHIITSVLTISPPSRILNNSGFRSLSIIRAGFPALAWLPGNGEGTGTNSDSYFYKRLPNMEQAVTSTSLYPFSFNLCLKCQQFLDFTWSLVDVSACRVPEMLLERSDLSWEASAALDSLSGSPSGPSLPLSSSENTLTGRNTRRAFGKLGSRWVFPRYQQDLKHGFQGIWCVGSIFGTGAGITAFLFLIFNSIREKWERD